MGETIRLVGICVGESNQTPGRVSEFGGAKWICNHPQNGLQGDMVVERRILSGTVCPRVSVATNEGAFHHHVTTHRAGFPRLVRHILGSYHKACTAMSSLGTPQRLRLLGTSSSTCREDGVGVGR